MVAVRRRRRARPRIEIQEEEIVGVENWVERTVAVEWREVREYVDGM